MSIRTGYFPGVIGKIVTLHAHYYSDHWQFGEYFEARVAHDLAAFIARYDESQDCLWTVWQDAEIEGGIAIDSSGEAPGIAHLRWFILSDAVRHQGLGNTLLRRAIDFARARGNSIFLTTFAGLGSARHLYEKYGFQLAEQTQGTQWGTLVEEQRFELIR